MQCNNFNLYPFGSQILVCGENLIADDVFAGDYFQTSGYVEGKAVLFIFLSPNDS